MTTASAVGRTHLRVQCAGCQKSYKVGIRLSGRQLRCRECRGLISVPNEAAFADSEVVDSGDAQVDELGSAATVDEFELHEHGHDSAEVDDESRVALLKELGIDPTSALEAYRRERDRCDGCGDQVAAKELEETLAGRLCRVCQAEAVSVKADSEHEGEEERARRALTARIEAPSGQVVLLYAALFFFGFAGLAHTVASLVWQPSYVASLAVALVVAGFGAHRIRSAH